MNPLHSCVLLIGMLALLTACDPPNPKKRAGVDWQPDRTYRGREMRTLPPSSQVEPDQKRWSESNTNKNAMIYTARLSDPARQNDLKVKHERMSSPLGNPWWTDASFKYTDPTNGSYIIRYHRLGHHKVDFLQLDDTPRLHWFLVDQLEMRDGLPVLNVIGIEGVTKFSAY